MVEAFAKGTPAIAAAGVDAMSELVDPGRTGLNFRIGDLEYLITQVEFIVEHPEKIAYMRQLARSEFENNYTATENYNRLMEI